MKRPSNSRACNAVEGLSGRLPEHDFLRKQFTLIVFSFVIMPSDNMHRLRTCEKYSFLRAEHVDHINQSINANGNIAILQMQQIRRRHANVSTKCKWRPLWSVRPLNDWQPVWWSCDKRSLGFRTSNLLPPGIERAVWSLYVWSNDIYSGLSTAVYSGTTAHKCDAVVDCNRWINLLFSIVN